MIPVNANDPVPRSAYPTFGPVITPTPAMPAVWTAVALLHPFSPPLSTDPQPDNPFFQLCVGNFAYVEGGFLSAQITGCDYGTWWYVITPEGTEVSTDQGNTWTPVDMGWSLPTNWFGGQIQKASCAGSSPLNWMPGPSVDWWSAPVPGTNPPAATWMWFDSQCGVPVRMMFGQGPPQPTKGDPTQLGIFQMYSFTYVPVFETLAVKLERSQLTWGTPGFPGFAKGNPDNYVNFEFNSNFGMTAFMTPVNQNFNPLPTRVLYVWKPDSEYSVYSDRAQDTLMLYDYNPNQPIEAQVALLTGPPPDGVSPPPESETGFLINYNADGTSSCIGGSQFPFPQEPPTWVSVPAVEARIQATITNNPVVSPGTTVTVFSVLFPPSAPNYPEATYLWTWYAPQNSDGRHSRPVTFMQSQSGVGVGTSLALADYFFYEDFTQPIDPSNFSVPTVCSAQTRKNGLRHRLP